MEMISKIKESTKYKIIHRYIIKKINKYFINNSKFLPENIDRVYHIHVRKSGGSTINVAFWNLAGYNLKKARREPMLIGHGKSIVRMSDELINEGQYFYASSHFPIWQLKLKPNTYTFTILRDPYKRLVSLYKYYSWVGQVDSKTGYELDPSFFVLKSQKHLLNKTFFEFINNLSNKYLYGNLFMFDENLDVEMALKNLNNVNRICFQDNLEDDTQQLSHDLSLNLHLPEAQRKFSGIQFNISDDEKEFALSKLKPEIEFYKKAVEIFKK